VIAPVFFGACIITDYPVICDNDQNTGGAGLHVVNTSGEAIIRPEGQIATIWPDGTDELLTYVQQDAAGNQILIGRNNFCPSGAPCQDGDGLFAGFVYMNPNSTGCWIVKAPNPFEGDDDIFDYEENVDCLGYRSLFTLASTGERCQEGGKDGAGGKGGGKGRNKEPTLTIDPAVACGDVLQSYCTVVGTPNAGQTAVDTMAALSGLMTSCDITEQYGINGFACTLDPKAFAVNIGGATDIAIDGVEVYLTASLDRILIDARTGNFPDVLEQLATHVDAYGNDPTWVSFSAFGITRSKHIKLHDAQHYRDLIANNF
jgi:hypothetical protein